MADFRHVLEESFLSKLTRDENMELNDSTTKDKEFAKYQQQNAKVGGAIVGAMES